MGQEVVSEKDFPCPCGKGILRIEVLEHDVWGSGRHSRSRILCDVCKVNFRELRFENVLVAREHKDEVERREHALYERRRALGNVAVERYLPQFKSHVKSLKFKSAMHHAIGGHFSIQKFRERTRFEQGLDEEIQRGLSGNPARALGLIGVDDAEITAELRSIAEEEVAVKAFVEGIEKYPIPNIDHDP